MKLFSGSISNQKVTTEMTKEWYKLVQKLPTQFGESVAHFRSASVARICCRN